MNDASRLDLLEIRGRFHKYNEYSKVYYVFLSFSYIFRIQVSILRLNMVSLSFKSVHRANGNRSGNGDDSSL
jgi:hypothetical protein